MSLRRFCTYFVAFGLCFVISYNLRSQQGNNWYFGNFAGLTFNTTPPSPLTDGQINSQEGCATISDVNGNLLFYTNGRTVFNRNHDLMLNGADLKGHVSSYQSSIIVPKPGSSTIYYIFTADAWENDGAGGYGYSEVDMTLDNGLGGITSNKNVFLSGPSSERLTAVRAADFSSYWVITNQWSSNIFRAYKVDCNGVSSTPVVSTLGLPMAEDTYCNIGALRVSADGNMIIQTNVKGRLQANPANEYAQLFDFDDVTGQLSNARVIPLLNDGYYFGAEFSPDSRFLYIVNPFKSTVHQYDVSSGDINTIVASKKIIQSQIGMCGISLGPDAKLYLTSSGTSLHVINQPNLAAPACNFVLDQQPLSRASILTLPNMIPNLYVNRPVDFTFQLVGSCTGGVQFTGVAQVPGVILQWDFGDGNTATGNNPMHTYSNANIEYVVKLTATNGSNCVFEEVSKRVRPSGEQVTANFSVVANCNSRTITITDSSVTGTGTATYNWDFGDGNTSSIRQPSPYVYNSNGLFTIRQIVSSSSGCVSDTMSITVDFSKPVVNAGPDILVSDISPIQLNATGASTYQWKPSLYLSDPNIGNPLMKARDAITYVVTGTNTGGCSDIDTLVVTIKENEIIEVPNAFIPGSTRNPVLRPVLRLVKGLNYFRVYNRWGEMVFDTRIIGQGWDGTYKGLPQPNGAYVWVLEAVDARGAIVRKRGSSVLIR